MGFAPGTSLCPFHFWVRMMPSTNLWSSTAIFSMGSTRRECVEISTCNESLPIMLSSPGRAFGSIDNPAIIEIANQIASFPIFRIYSKPRSHYRVIVQYCKTSKFDGLHYRKNLDKTLQVLIEIEVHLNFKVQLQ